MKKSFFTCALIAAAIIATLLYGGSSFGRSGFTQPDLLKVLEDEWKAYKRDKPNFSGALALQILSPKGDYFISTGMGEEVKNNCHFRIASVTKTFTAAGIMLLNQRKALNIDDKITDMIPGTNIPYVPNTPDYDIPYKDNITIRMLLMHRAGVFDQSNNIIPDTELSRGIGYAGKNYLEYMLAKDKDHTFTCDELVGVNARNNLSFFKPGTAYHYSDTGYSMLGKIIERVSGKSYGDFIKDELLVPGGLLDTSLPYKGSDQAIPAPFARGYVWKSGVCEEVTASNMSPHVAEGNIISTPLDLATWCKKLFKGETALTKETVEMMKEGMTRDDAPGSKYGLGILSSPETGYGHGGAHEGYLTLMYYDPNTDTAYAMFTNIWDIQNDMDSIKAQFKCMMETAHKIFKEMR